MSGLVSSVKPECHDLTWLSGDRSDEGAAGIRLQRSWAHKT